MKDRPRVISLDDLAAQMLPKKIITAVDLSFKPVETDMEEEEPGGRIILTISKPVDIDCLFPILSLGEVSDHEEGASHLN